MALVTEFHMHAEQQAQADATFGDPVTLTFDPPDSGTKWLIDRCVVANDSSECTAVLYVVPQGGQNDLRLRWQRDATNVAGFDVAEYPQGLLVEDSQQLVIQFTAVAPSSDCFAHIQYRQMVES